MRGLPLVTLLIAAFGCGGVTDTTLSDDRDSGDAGKGRSPLPDGNPFVQDACPEAGPPQAIHECNVQDPSGTCPPFYACYPIAEAPQVPCGSETYGSRCFTAGAGTQGAPCQGMSDCAPGFACVVSGSMTECAQTCDLSAKPGCPAGLVCGPIDVPGYATCL